MPPMSPLPKYVLFSCAAVGLAWTSVSVEVKGRTPYGHFLSAGGDTWVDGARSSWASAWRSARTRWDDLVDDSGQPAARDERAPTRRKARPAQKATPAPRPTVQEESGAKRRVALLEAAEKQMKAKTEKAQAGRQTHLDQPATKADRAALDRIVAGQ